MTNKSNKPKKSRRSFSVSVRKAIVKEIDKGLSKAEASRKYEVSQATIYRWIKLYSPNYTPTYNTIVEHKSQTNKVNKQKAELKRVYEELGRAQLHIKVLEKLIDTASNQLGIDLKKNSDSTSLDTSVKMKKSR